MSKAAKMTKNTATLSVKPEVPAKPYLIRSTGEIKQLPHDKACIYQTLRDQESPENIDGVYEQAKQTLGGSGVEYDDDIVLHRLATEVYGYTGPIAYTKDEFATYYAKFKNAEVDETRILVAATKENSLKTKLTQSGADAFQKEFAGGTMAGGWHVFGFHRTKKGKAECFDEQYKNKESGTTGYVVYMVWGRGDR